MKRIVVIGGVAAGMSAAAGAKRTDPGSDVVVLEKGEYISYGSCGLPYFISNNNQGPEDLIVLTPGAAEQKKGVRVKINCEVVGINTAEKKVLAKDVLGGKENEIFYDKLIIATGSEPVRPEIKGIDLENVFFLKSLSQGIKLKKHIETAGPKSAAIIGDGHIALEMAENFRKSGIEKITIMGRNSHLCWWLDSDMAGIVENKALENGIRVIKGCRVSEIARDENEKLRVIYGEDSVSADIVFVSMGMKPKTEIAKAAGIRTDSRQCIDVNDFMETSAPDVYAAGDCANVFFRSIGKRIYMPRGTTANKQGRIAGYNAAGGKREFKGVEGVVIFKFFDLEVARAGLNEEMAVLRKIEAVSAGIRSRTKAAYYPKSERIHVKLTADKKSGKIIGAQIAGGEGSGKRIDFLSLALYNEMKVEEMKDMDMAYAPPFAPVWDPVLVAVNNLAKEIPKKI
ncbi:MAG TPA: hypothetical protein ENN55_01645 [Firmicutes bacterium]|nr:hypothetical protein [Bacillota bacterium]